MKHRAALSFEGGTISIKLEGFSAQEIGSGELAFRDEDLDYEEDNYRVARIDKTELRAIRDFLNQTLTDQ